MEDTGVRNGNQAGEGAQKHMKGLDLNEISGIRATNCYSEIREFVRRLWFEVELG